MKYENSTLGISIEVNGDLRQRHIEAYEKAFNTSKNAKAGYNTTLGGILRAAVDAGWIVSSVPVIEPVRLVYDPALKTNISTDPIGDLPPSTVKAFGMFLNDVYVEYTTIPNV